MKPWWKSKTHWFNILVVLSPIVAYMASSEVIMQQFLTPKNFLLYSSGIGFVNVVLRSITTQGVTFFQEVPPAQ